MSALPLPPSIAHMGEEEDTMRDMALSWIAQDVDLSIHMGMITLCLDTASRAAHQAITTFDGRTLQLLAFRVFNSMAASLRLTTHGYFQSAGMVWRDLYETGWLVSYLHTYPEKIAIWSHEKDRKIRKEFEPHNIRKALNARDKFAHDHRSKIYWDLCGHASHPSFAGLYLLGPPGQDPNCGAFMEMAALSRTLEGLVEACTICAANVSALVDLADDESSSALGRFYIATNEWNASFHGVPFPEERRDEIRKAFGVE